MKMYPEFFKPFPTRLRECLDKTHTSGKQLGDYCGCSPQTISNYSLGKSKPDIYTLKKIASFFKVTTDYLLTCENEYLRKYENEPVSSYDNEKDKKTVEEDKTTIEDIRKTMRNSGLYWWQIARELHISEPTMYRKIREPVAPETILVIKATIQKILSAREG